MEHFRVDDEEHRLNSLRSAEMVIGMNEQSERMRRGAPF